MTTGLVFGFDLVGARAGASMPAGAGGENALALLSLAA